MGREVPSGRGQAAAAAGQFLLLAGLVTGTGLALPGVVAGVAYAAGLSGLLAWAMRRAARRTLGPADLVTLGRAGLVGGVTALVVAELTTGGVSVPVLVVIAAVALALDAVDGRVARRTGTVSPLGARFDMEVDAFLLLVLSGYAATIVGPWALAIGGMRYVFVVAGWAMAWLRGPLPPNLAAKTVAALQGVVLVVTSAEVLDGVFAAGLVAAALAALGWSFGRDVLRLWRDRQRQEAPGRENTLTSPGSTRSGTVQPSRSYSDMQRSTIAL